MTSGSSISLMWYNGFAKVGVRWGLKQKRLQSSSPCHPGPPTCHHGTHSLRRHAPHRIRRNLPPPFQRRRTPPSSLAPVAGALQLGEACQPLCTLGCRDLHILAQDGHSWCGGDVLDISLYVAQSCGRGNASAVTAAADAVGRGRGKKHHRAVVSTSWTGHGEQQRAAVLEWR